MLVYQMVWILYTLFAKWIGTRIGASVQAVIGGIPDSVGWSHCGA